MVTAEQRKTPLSITSRLLRVYLLSHPPFSLPPAPAPCPAERPSIPSSQSNPAVRMFVTPHLPSLGTSSPDHLPCGLSFLQGSSRLPVRGSGTHCPGHGAPWTEEDPACGWGLMKDTTQVPASHSGPSALQPVLCTNVYDAPLCVCARAPMGHWVHLPGCPPATLGQGRA